MPETHCTPQPPTSVARYEHVDAAYLEQRALRKSAGWVLLWALGVGAVISGDYFGWSFGLAVGGFGGLAAATLLMAVMYVCMVFSIAELSAALPHAGGFYSFARSALGPTAGFICGVTDTIEYVLTPAVIVVGIGGYLGALLPAVPPTLLWFAAYALFVGINIRGVELTLRIGLVITVLAVLVLACFYVGSLASGAFDARLLTNIPPQAGHTALLPFGVRGIFAALPFAMWFYLAIEQLPLAAEEAHDTVRDMPRALILGIVTLLVLSLLTLVLNTGVGGGAAALAVSDAPLADGFVAVLGDSATTTVLTLIALTGLVASFHTTIYAYGRVLFALSRSGYFPRWISLTSRRQTPHLALLLGAVLGYLCTLAIHLSGTRGAIGAALLNMTVFGAVISYAVVLVSFIKLRVARPDLPRPYRSPLGVPGAVVGLLLSLLALASTFAVESFRPAVWGVAIFITVALLYYALYSRHRLVANAPEEAVALNR
jgi:ethanolamine permease